MNVYEVINNRIIELLEKGTIPWHRPWNAGTGYPKNFVSRKEYRGINVFLLGCQQYSSPYWLTFKQVQDKGGHVLKGSKSTPVIFWKFLDAENADSKDECSASPKGKVPLLRYYSVFNLEQTEGIKAPETQEVVNEFSPIEKAEQIISSMPHRPDIQFGGNQACYRPISDTITLPPKHTFESSEEFYSTCFHELIHSTGHISRLGRKSILEPSSFGSHVYSKEELLAEMGAAFLCGYSGIEQRTIENSAAYIQGWLKVLKNEKKLLVHAAAQAQKASDYILDRKEDEKHEHAEDLMLAS